MGLTIEAFVEFYINGLMNFQTAEWGMNGENLGIMLAFFCLAMDLIVLLFSLYIISKPLKKLKSKKAKALYGEMYENTKY